MNTLNACESRDLAASKTWGALSVLCALFSAVYLHFSYGVSSPFMVCLAAVPLVLGCLVQLAAAKLHASVENNLAFGAYQALVATITVGFLVAGILAIADSPSGLLWLFPVLGLGCAGAGLAGLAAQKNNG